MKLTHFLLLAATTALATYWMNASLLTGQFFWAGLFGMILLRNLRFSYRVTKFIKMVEASTKR